MPHKSNKQRSLFVHISTESGRDVKVTKNHVLPSGACGSVLPLVYASQVHVGECIMTVSGEEKISKVETVQGEGVYTVVTKEEYIVVNGIIASPFGANHMMANLYYNMHRFLYALSPLLLASEMLQSVNEGLGVAIPLFGSV
jgi:Hint module